MKALKVMRLYLSGRSIIRSVLFLRGVLEPNHVKNLVMTVQVTKI